MVETTNSVSDSDDLKKEFLFIIFLFTIIFARTQLPFPIKRMYWTFVSAQTSIVSTSQCYLDFQPLHHFKIGQFYIEYNYNGIKRITSRFNDHEVLTRENVDLMLWMDLQLQQCW